MNLQILIVEDHDDLREMAAERLRGIGFCVREANSLVSLNRALIQAVPQVLLLDLNLPDANGLDIARRLRQAHPLMGIVVITGRNKVTDRAEAYASGVDVFLKKPFDSAELLAVVQTLGRRVLGAQPPLHEPMLLDTARGLLRVPSGEEVKLSTAEVRLLQVLALAPPEGMGLNHILESTQSSAGDVRDHNTVRLQVHRLRAKLASQPQAAHLLQSVRGMGYRLAQVLRVV